jgi:hypothetical protein
MCLIALQLLPNLNFLDAPPLHCFEEGLTGTIRARYHTLVA